MMVVNVRKYAGCIFNEIMLCETKKGLSHDLDE